MPAPATVILSAGGMRSLVALAVEHARGDHRRLILLHVADGQPNEPVRLEHVRRQAEHFEIRRVESLDLHAGAARADDGSGRTPALLKTHLLMLALSHAADLEAERLIVPAQVDGEFDRMAVVSEQAQLIEHLAGLEATDLPSIELPFIDLSDQQLVELGAQMDVPWHLAWTCTVHRDRACGACPACRRRHRAFESAGLLDPAAHGSATPASPGKTPA